MNPKTFVLAFTAIMSVSSHSLPKHYNSKEWWYDIPRSSIILEYKCYAFASKTDVSSRYKLAAVKQSSFILPF